MQAAQAKRMRLHTAAAAQRANVELRAEMLATRDRRFNAKFASQRSARSRRFGQRGAQFGDRLGVPVLRFAAFVSLRDWRKASLSDDVPTERRPQGTLSRLDRASDAKTA